MKKNDFSISQRNEKLTREYYNRTQSERVLDRHIISKTNMKQIFELEKEIQSQKEKKVKIENQKEILPHEALTQVLKFLKVEQKSFRAVEKIQTLFANFLDHLHPEHVIQTLYELTQCNVSFKREYIRKITLEIFESLENRIENYSPGMKNIFELLSIELKTHNKLLTDDQFQFNSQVRVLEKIIQSMKEEILKNDDGIQYGDCFKVNSEIAITRAITINKHKETREQVQSIREKLQGKNVPATAQTIKMIPEYDFQYSDQMQEILSQIGRRIDLKRSFLMSILTDLVTFYKKPWSKPTVNQFMQNLYQIDKQIFTVEQQGELDQLMTKMQNLKSQLQSDNAKSQSESAKMMKDYLHPTHSIVDSRSTIIVTDNINAWASKQSGL